MAETFLTFWGKARPLARATVAFHPAWAHGLDVPAVGRALVRAKPRVFRMLASQLGIDRDAFEALWVHLLAIHDIGKFSPLFQLKAPLLYPPGLAQPDATARRVSDPGHPTAGLLLIGGWLEGGGAPGVIPPLMQNWTWGDREALLQPIFGHHGRPVALPNQAWTHRWTDLFRPAEAAEAALAFWAAVDAILPAPSITPPDPRAAAAASWTLAGLTTLADWIGSTQAWFPYVAPETDMASYWVEACWRADKAVAAAGLVPARPAGRLPFRDLTGVTHPATATQAWADSVALPEGPILIIIEDVTGGGKTEAALTLAHRLLAADRAQGIYVALPTMATANAMLDRIGVIAPRLYDATTPPSLALAHGRAALHPRFRPLAEAVGDRTDTVAPENEGDSATVASAWLMSESRKALLADLGVGTIDQGVLAVLPNRYGTVRLAGLAGKVLIIDEVHSYDAYVGAETERLVAFHAAGGGSTILLSATLPAAAKRKLVEAWRKALGEQAVRLAKADYPLATLVAPGVPPVEAPLAARPDLCRRLRITRVPDASAALRRIAEAARAGACVAWIRNTVDDAVEGLVEVRDMGLEADLFHARFAMGDRLAIERRIVERFGKRGVAGERCGRVVVATQVLEASLDLDFDLIVSDLAPIDSLLQRAGRLWRHPRGERPIAGPDLVVVSPDPSGAIAGDWVTAAFPRAAKVYADHGVLWRTAREVTGRPSFHVPEDVRAVIEAVYLDGDDADIPRALERIRNDAIGRRGAERGVAHQNLLVVAEGYGPDGRGWENEAFVATRLAEESRRVRLARVENGVLAPWHAEPDPRLAWALSEVTAYERKLGGRHRPEKRLEAQATAARAGWGRFEDDVILLPLEEVEDGVWRGVLVDDGGRRLEVGYSALTGLMLGQGAADAGMNR